MKYCPACGNTNPDDARFCESCGASQPAIGPQGAVYQTPSAGAPGPRRTSYRPLLIIVAVVAAAYFGYSMFLKPMSVSAYEDRVDELWDDISHAQGDLYDALEPFYYPDEDYDREIDARDWDEAATDARAALKEIKSGAKKLKGLRPPDTYDREHADIAAGCSHLTGEYATNVEDVLKRAEGRDYGDVSDMISEYYDGSDNRAMTDMYDGLGTVLDWEGE